MSNSPDEIRDELPDDLNVTAFVGPYKFPDNSRRRIPGIIYLVIAAILALLWFSQRDNETSMVSDGFLGSAIFLGLVGLFSLSASWRMTVDEKLALVYATRAVGFAVGHASAQQVWRGFRSRPTWRVMIYSAQEPPLQRGLVLIDAIDARVIECLVESNPES
ncbi:MAG: hypothetical protein O2841_00060 [Actinomycetota bacterium]|nr:hypothetical protein [Actinomycetota bacterium]